MQVVNKASVKDIKAFWDEQANQHGTKFSATVPDKFLKKLEIENIIRYLPNKDNAKIIDLGSGNGFSTLAFAKARRGKFTGVDYSTEMINQAGKLLQQNKNLKNRLSFQVGDVLKLSFVSQTFNCATTDRCLINLVSLADQKKALKEIWRILKPKGKYIMCEDTQEGLAKLNQLRSIAGLKTIPNHWHNLYLNEQKLLPYLKKYFKILAIDNFSSTYYIGSRIYNALAAVDPAKPDYLSKINNISSKLPAFGDYSPLKIFYLEKK